MDNDFPKELLFQSIDDRIEFYKKKSVGHPKLVNAYKDLMDIVDVVEGDVLLVYGPSGVGKSTLFKKVKNEYLKRYQDEMRHDKGLIPVLAVEAFAPEDGKFDWIDFYSDSLKELRDILIDEKVMPMNEKRLSLNEMGISVPTNSNQKTKRKLRNALESAIKCRKVKIILIDEAQHMTKVGSSNGLRNHMDAIKSLASKFGVPIILFGTYELLNFRNKSGQLGRRTIDIHFPRYNSEIPEEVNSFKSALLSFQKAFPLYQEPNLIEEWKYFYKYTIGCIGTLRDWLYKTYRYQMNLYEDTKTLTIRDFKKFEPTIDQAYTMAEEIIKGETHLTNEREVKANKLNTLLNLEQLDENGEKNKTKNRRPGERKPTRDKTGTDL